MVTPTTDRGHEDAFDTLVTKGTSNEIDIATHYNFSPERVRLFKNGNRQFVQYNSIAEFTDNRDHWLLQPSGGDTMHIESAESAAYVVNYQLQASFALQLNQSLQSGDKLRFGPYGGDNGWLVEQRGADHDDTHADIIEASGGTETTLESDVELPKPTTEWHRYECRYSWYNVGNQEWLQTYTDGGEQFNDTFAETANDGVRGPEDGNLNVWYEIQADSGTSNLELEVGSMGIVTLGDTTQLQRDKPQRVELTLDATDNTWLPVYALRIDPDNDSVNARLTELEVLRYGNNADLELVVSSMSPSKTDISDTDWGVPGYHHAQNSALESTTSVSQVPDDTGTQKTLTSSDKFGGYTFASSSRETGGNTTSVSTTRSSTTIQKKSVLASDHLVFLARTGNGGGELTFQWDADQNW